MSMGSNEEKKDASRQPGHPGDPPYKPMDPETDAAFEASYERNKEAMERLAKL